MKKKSFNLNEVTDSCLGNLEVSTDDWDNNDDSNFHSAKIFIRPSVKVNNENSNIESGDDDQPTGDAIT